MINTDIYKAYIRESNYKYFDAKIFWNDFLCLNNDYDCTFIDDSYKYMIELNNQNIPIHPHAICVIIRISINNINKIKSVKFITKYIVDNYQIMLDKYKVIYKYEDYELKCCADFADMCLNKEREYKLKRILYNEEL